MRISELATPALLVDRLVLERNLDRMASRAERLGVALRPHIKTHKCVEVACLQAERGARGLTVSTLDEAYVFLNAGFDDLTWAFPLSPDKIAPALELARRGTLRLLLDDPRTFSELERVAAAGGAPPHVWLKIDCGYHRAGVDPESPAAIELARRMATSTAVIFDGLLTHAGHSYSAYDPDLRRRVANEERDAVVGLAQRLRQEEIDVPGVSIGSTPTVTIVEDLTGVTEARPGNYALHDLMQVALGTCGVEDIAVSVLATVVSHPDGAERAVINAGALALSKDPGPDPRSHVPSMGGISTDVSRPATDPTLILESLTQEHGVIRPAGANGLRGRLPVGARVRVLPNHSCLAVACFDRLHVLEGDEIVDTWKVHRER